TRSAPARIDPTRSVLDDRRRLAGRRAHRASRLSRGRPFVLDEVPVEVAIVLIADHVGDLGDAPALRREEEPGVRAPGAVDLRRERHARRAPYDAGEVVRRDVQGPRDSREREAPLIVLVDVGLRLLDERVISGRRLENGEEPVEGDEELLARAP